MDNSSTDLNRAIEGLIRGREFTRRLKEIIKKSGGEVENIMAEDLVAKILDSFSETLSVINNSDVVVATAVEVKSPEDYSSGSCKSSDRRGCYKRRKTSESDIKESSDLVDDGHAWRKYGQKQILNSTYPRHYFRCTHKYDQKCQASKQVQKIQDNPQRFRTTYYGHHTCKAFPRVSQIILDSPMDGNSNYISFDQNHTFPSIKQETKEEVVFRFYPKIEDQIQSSSSDYFLPNDHDHDHLTPNFIGNRTPQVYYEGEIIQNLDTELARAAKLKCSSCGMKGAALGCYVTSCRRSYHVPCAFEIQDCQWDMENYVMLCPVHKSVKFPSEKSKSIEHIRREMHPKASPLTTEQLTFWARSSDGPKEWVLCGSALSSEDKYMLVKFDDMCGATACKFWRPNVTHVVATTDVKGACTRTMKFLMAILSGKWIPTMDWVKACVAANGPVNEEHYEISLVNYGRSGGPKAGRLMASANGPKLFDGFEFYFIGDFMPDYKSDLLDLVEKAGGSVIHSEEQLVKQNHAAQETQPSSLVVYNCDLSQGCFEEKIRILLQRLAEAEDLAEQMGSQTVQHTWILESIAACKLVPFC